MSPLKDLVDLSATTRQARGGNISTGLLILLATISLLGIVAVFASGAHAQEGTSRKLEFHIGATTILIDDNLIISVGKRSGRDLGESRSFNINAGESIHISLPANVVASYSPPCKQRISDFIVRNITMPRRSEHLELRRMQPKPSAFPGVSKLEPIGGLPNLDLFQFDSGNLRDYWNEPISFSRGTVLIQVIFQFRRDVSIILATSSEECFFRQGPVFLERLLSYLNKISSN